MKRPALPAGLKSSADIKPDMGDELMEPIVRTPNKIGVYFGSRVGESVLHLNLMREPKPPFSTNILGARLRTERSSRVGQTNARV